jgi:D-arabinose 1-dehydrogenase-like Zn-dependent alcohol dehydrogenase
MNDLLAQVIDAHGGLGVNGKLVIVGAADEPLEVPAIPLILGRRSIMGWPSGSSIDSQDTLSFSVLTGVRAMTEIFPLERAAEAYEHMMSGKARFRAVLTTGR